MTDHPIPDDLLKQMYVATGHGAGGAPFVPRRYVAAVLTALAEWADGALIDPDGWRRLDAKHRMMTDREGNSIYTLTERADQ